ncbi:MAG: NAD kinase [Mycobacteriales bacterium]
MSPQRAVLLVAHTGRDTAVEAACSAAKRLLDAGIDVRVLPEEAAQLALDQTTVVTEDCDAAEGVEIVLVLGGDGTLLRASELARHARVPMMGVNLGHVGFLAEAEPEALDAVVERILDRGYTVEERLTLDVTVSSDGVVVDRGWALNEMALEKASRARMLEVVLEIDDRPLSRWGCDGVVCATPTGSTAYAFSAGGPVVWPEVEALLVVPISAHALFSRPLVVGPDSVVALEVLPGVSQAVLSCDGRRRLDLPRGARIEVRRGSAPVLLARTQARPFADRLVAKFDLPVEGWRGRRD